MNEETDEEAQVGPSNDHDAPQRFRVRAQIERWAKDLIDLTKRNTSLHYRPLKRGTVELVSPSAARIFQGLLQLQPDDRLSFFHPPRVDPGQPGWTVEEAVAVADPDELVTERTTAADLDATLRNLARQAESDLVDRGLHSLYLCFGMLAWKERHDDDSEIRSPLVFVPVKLVRGGPGQPYHLAPADEDGTLNSSLEVALDEQFDIQLPVPDFDQMTSGDALIDYLQQVRQTVSLQGWSVEASAILKRATFHKEAMFRDLRENAEKIAAHDLVAAIADPRIASDELEFAAAEPPSEDELDRVAPPEQLNLILDADASQRRAIEAAKRGVSFVMDGPPGTGKSQTIANLLAELMAAGRSILFVSEKVAALDVVTTRLRDHGLDEFLFELHSHKASRKQVAAELGKALSQAPVAKPQLASSALAKAQRSREQLSAYAHAVNETRRPLGQSAHQVLGRLAQLAGQPGAPEPTGVDVSLTADKHAELIDAFHQLARLWHPVVEGEQFPWRGLARRPPSEALRVEIVRLLESAQRQVDDTEELAQELAYQAALPLPRSGPQARALSQMLAHAAECPFATHTAWLSDPALPDVRERVIAAEQRAATYEHLQAELDHHIGPQWTNLTEDSATRVASARERLAELWPSLPTDGGTTLAMLRRQADWFERATSELGELDDEIHYLARALGADERPRTPMEALALAEVAEQADALERPEPSWTSRVALAQVQQAVDVLAPLIQDHRNRYENLANTFTDEVYELDLQGLTTRFETVHTGPAKLRKAFREDKRVVANVSRTGKADPSVRERLLEARDLQKLRSELDDREAQHAHLLGRYYAPRAADTDAASRAIQNLQTAIERLGDAYDPERIAAQLAGPHPEDRTLGQRGARTRGRLQKLIETGRVEVGHQPLQQDCSALARWAEQARVQIDRVLEVTDQLGSGETDRWTLKNLNWIATRRQTAAELHESIEAAQPQLAQDLGNFAQDPEADWSALREGLDWALELQRLRGAALSHRSAERLHAGPAIDSQPLDDALDELDGLIQHLCGYFEPARQEELRQDLDGPFNEMRAILSDLSSRATDIDTWLRLQQHFDALVDRGWKAPLSFCRDEHVESDQLPEVLEKALLSAWYGSLTEQEPLLADARAQDLDARVVEFRKLDQDLVANAAERVVAACLERRPHATIGPTATIQRESQKRSRHLPVRKLLSEARDIVTDLKPVFMMSPLSVSQYLPSDFTFDVVVFDEASQITPADAVNCIYRGRQLIVAGDERQLPPTSFFQQGAFDEEEGDDEEVFEDFESILNPCKGSLGMESLPLRWHYRSQHEDLITFSNYRFYDGNLVTFPSATSSAEDLGVHLFNVGGVYRRGGPRDNPTEAAKVAERVMHHAEAHPHHTLGVVAFSQAQAEAIEDAVERARVERPELEDFFNADRLYGFFVKNLESVQGDERDIMIFSVGYGPDENGKITMNFGPLNREGGWRRLNVAITRARRRVEVISSVDAAHLDTRTTSAVGVIELQRYLDYAARGHPALAIDLSQSEGDVESPLEESVLETLRSWGYEVVPQLGAAGYRIDLAVRHPQQPGRFVLGIECDGATYHSSKVARDRDRLRQKVLEGLGWTLHRIWAPSWYQDRSGQEQRLREATEAALEGRPAAPVSTRPRQRVERELEEVSLDETPSWASEYKPISLGRGQTSYPPHDPRAASLVRTDVGWILHKEAPIHEELVAQRLAWEWGYNATKRIRRVVGDVLTELKRSGQCEQAGDFIWIDPAFHVRVPSQYDERSRRKVEHIPPEELQYAVEWLLTDARSADEEELLVRVARLFGFQRTGANIRVALEDALDVLLGDGRVEVTADGRLRPATSGN